MVRSAMPLANVRADSRVPLPREPVEQRLVHAGGGLADVTPLPPVVVLLGDAERDQPVARRPEDLGDLLRILELRAEAPRRDCLRAALREERVRVLARVSLRDALRVFHR